MKKQIFLFAICLFLLFQQGCGYSWQGKYNPWKDKGINRIYIKMLVNNSQRVGVETQVTSALVKELSRVPRFKIINDEKEADAVLEGVIDSAGSNISSTATVSTISSNSKAKEIGDMLVASEYSGFINIKVAMRELSAKRVIWSQAFSRVKNYPGGNQFGNEGNTSALINSSQEQNIFNDISNLLAVDVNDALMESF